MLSSSKSPSSTDNVPSKKKRKIISSSIESKSPKMIKLATKENLVKSVPEKEGEDASEGKLDSSNDSIEIITSNDEKKGLDQNDQQKARKSDNTPKNRNLGKNKKVDRSQQKPGALTKFLKRTDREVEESDISHDNNLSKLKNKDCQDTPVHKEKNEICLNENSDVQLIPSELQDTSRLNETNRVANKDVDSSLQESDCDITILSSDNETSSELDKSISNRNKEITDGPATPVNPKTDKDIKEKIKRLTPKQLEKRQEIARRKEEKKRLKMVCIIHRRGSNFIFISL